MADLEGNKFPDDLTHHTTPIGADAILIHDSVANETKYTLLSEMTTNGANGLGITGQGDYADEDALIAAKGPLQAGWVYYDEGLKKSLLRNAANDTWVTLAESILSSSEDIGSAVYIRVDWQDANNLEDFIYTVPRYMVLTTQESEGSDATLTPPLSTTMAPYTKLTIHPTSVGLITLKGTVITSFADVTPPVISSFSCPSTSTSLTIMFTTFAAYDEHGVTGYMVTVNSATPPLPSAAGWSIQPLDRITVLTNGTYTLYGWAKDAAGNVSTAVSNVCVVNVPTATQLKLSWGTITDAQDWLTAGGKGNMNLVASWNSLLGSVFDSVTISGNDILLEGGTPFVISQWMFTACTTLTGIVDPNKLVTQLGAFAFLNCSSLNVVDLQGVLSIGESAFEGTFITSLSFPACTSVTGPNIIKNAGCSSFIAPACTSVPANCFNFGVNLTYIDLRSCTGMGLSAGNNDVFNNISNNTITLIVPVVLQTNNAGGKDGDINYLLTQNPTSPEPTWI